MLHWVLLDVKNFECFFRIHGFDHSKKTKIKLR
jgi:hypothetical protein